MIDVVEIDKKFKSILLRYCNTLTYNQEDSNDIYQSVMLKLHKNRCKYEAGKPIKTFLKTSIFNEFVDKYRSKKVHEVNVYKYHSIYPQIVQNEGENNLQFLKIKSIFDKLTGTPREIIRMRYEGYTFKEISKILKRTLPSVKSIYYSNPEINRVRFLIKRTLHEKA